MGAFTGASETNEIFSWVQMCHLVAFSFNNRILFSDWLMPQKEIRRRENAKLISYYEINLFLRVKIYSISSEYAAIQLGERSAFCFLTRRQKSYFSEYSRYF